MGVMIACFHCFGTVHVLSESLNNWAMGAAKTGAPRRRNQAGNPSRPVAVGRRWSRIWKTCISSMHSVTELQVSLNLDGCSYESVEMAA